MITEIKMKTAIIILIIRICFFSFNSLIIFPLIKSNVSVELEVRTSAAKVDIDADKTNTITIPINTSGSDCNILGIIASNITPFSSLWIAGESNNLANPPKK